MASFTAEEARASFTYDPATGIITRTKGTGSALLGAIQHRDNGDGYGRVTFKSERVYIHRLAWLLHYGEWPKRQVDHIDGDRTNNRAANLRDVGHTANAQNIHKANSNTGILGVSYCQQRKKFVARISVGPRGSSKTIHLGRFGDVERARQAYLAAKAKYHPAATIAA